MNDKRNYKDIYENIMKKYEENEENHIFISQHDDEDDDAFEERVVQAVHIAAEEGKRVLSRGRNGKRMLLGKVDKNISQNTDKQ